MVPVYKVLNVRPPKIENNLNTKPVRVEYQFYTDWVAYAPLFDHVHNKDSAQTGLMPRLI